MNPAGDLPGPSPGDDAERDGVRERIRPREPTLGRTLFLLLLAAVATAPAACAVLGGSSGGNPLEEGARDRTIRVTIQNQNYKDATVWAHWNGNRVRVGRITGSTSETFEIRYRSEDVRFEVDFLAGDGYTGRPISVSPGDHLELTIRPGG